MSTVAILGAGDLGGSIAQALAAGGQVPRVLLIDAAAPVAAGKALDIQQSGAIEGFHCRLAATDDVTAVAGAAVCVVADRAGAPAVEWHGDEGLPLLRRLVSYASDSPIVFAGAAQAGLLLHAGRDLGLPARRLVGSAPEAYASAVRAIVALEVGCSPGEVTLAVLGAPPVAGADARGAGGGLVIPWSEASIGGYAVERVLTPVQIRRAEGRAARLWPPGPYTLGAAAARVVEGMLAASRRTFSAMTLLDGEFGVKDRVGILPVRLSSRGVEEVRVPVLNARERVLLETALGAP